MGRIGGRFARVEPRRHARSMVLGLLAELPRTNCWTIAEHAGQAGPYALQHLLSRAVWDHDGVRDDLRGYIVDHLGCDDAVLVVDETGDLKKGVDTVGAQRQYTGTAGRIENLRNLGWPPGWCAGGTRSGCWPTRRLNRLRQPPVVPSLPGGARRTSTPSTSRPP
jgi:hypothetical protein